MSASISIDSEAVREITSRAILDAIGAEQRDLVVQQAVESLLEPGERDRYTGKPMHPAPLVIAFRDAVRDMAGHVVRDYLDTPEVKARVNAAIRDKVTAMLADEGGWLYGTIGFAVADRIEQIMRGER